MHAEERRETILKLLRQSAQPVSASTLAAQLSVSRQIIVGDIALLRAGGADILATPRGYCLQNAAVAGLTRRYDVAQFIARSHTAQPLSVLTGGIHLHTLLCPSEDAYRRVLDALRQAGFLLEG